MILTAAGHLILSELTAHKVHQHIQKIPQVQNDSQDRKIQKNASILCYHCLRMDWEHIDVPPLPHY